jgi:ribosomal protein S1
VTQKSYTNDKEWYLKSITNYGVFVEIYNSTEIGVIDGLLHITDISCGQVIKTKIIKIDRETGRISLGVKQLEDSGIIVDWTKTFTKQSKVFPWW